MTPRHLAALLILIPIMLCSIRAGADDAIYGTWQLNKDESTDLAAWRHRVLHLDIRDHGDAITIVHDWRHRGYGSWTDSLTVSPGQGPVTQLVESAIWPGNWFMGVLARIGSGKTTRATWLETDRRLATETELVVEVSQGEATITVTCEYALGAAGDRLTLTERRSTRPTPVKMVFDRVVRGTGE